MLVSPSYCDQPNEPNRCVHDMITLPGEIVGVVTAILTLIFGIRKIVLIERDYHARRPEPEHVDIISVKEIGR